MLHRKVYNGESKSPVVPTNPGYTQSGGTLSAEDAGEYTVTFTLTDNYRWSGEENESTSRTHSATWQIKRAVFVKPELDDDTFVYSSGVTVNISAYIIGYVEGESPYELSVDTSKTNAGDYSVTLTLNKNYCTQAGEQTDFSDKEYAYSLSWHIQRKGVVKPSEIQKDFTYDKTEKKYSEDSPAYDVAGYEQEEASATPINAGVYDVVFKLDPNYCWGADGSSDTADFTLAGGMVINRAPVEANPEMEGKNTDSALANGTYNEQDQTKTATGYDAEKMSVTAAAVESDDTITQNVNGSEVTFSAKNAGSYTITFELLDSDNYTWKTGGVTDPAQENKPTIEFTWKINKAPNSVQFTDGTYAGWKYGEAVTEISTLGLSAEFDDESLNSLIECTYYLEDGTPLQGGISSVTPAGDYYLRVVIPNGDNTLESEPKDFAFTIEKNTVSIKGSASIEKPELANEGNWFYRDPLTDHELTYRAMVGVTDITDVATQVKYYRVIEGGEELISSADLATADAGNYKVVIKIAGTDDYDGASHVIEFTIQKYAVSVPEFTRSNLYSGAEWTPTDIPETGERESSWTVQFPAPDSPRGLYWAVLTLTDPDNYTWDEMSFLDDSDPTTEQKDHFKEGVEGAVEVWYRIALAPYDKMDLRFDGEGIWTYGEDHTDLLFGRPNDVTEAKITYEFELLAGDTPLSGFAGTYDKIVWPTAAGIYRLTINIPNSANYESCSDTIKFTINKAEISLTAKKGATAVYGTPATGINWNWDGDNDPLNNFTLAEGQYFYGDENNLAEVFKNVELTFSAVGYDRGSAVGKYAVEMSASGTAANYTISCVNAANALEITKLALTGTIQNPEGDDLIYSNTAKESKFIPGNLVEGDQLEYGYKYFVAGGSSLEADKPVNVGTYYVVVTLTGGADFGNYSIEGDKISFEEDPFTIVPRELTPVWEEESLSYTYGASAKAEVSFLELISGTDPDAKLSYRVKDGDDAYYSGSGVPVNAGSYIVTVTLNNENYCFGDSEGSYIYFVDCDTDYVIKKATLTLTADDVSVTYGNSILDSQYGFKASGLQNGDQIGELLEVAPEYYWAGSGGKEYAAGDNVGADYIVTIRHSFTLDNYDVEIVAGKLTVEQRALTVTITAPDQTYTGGRLEPTISLGNLFEGDERREEEFYTDTYTKDGAVAEPIDAGVYTVNVALSAEGSKNYSINEETSTLSEEYEIAPAELKNVSIDPVTGLTYTGEAYNIEEKSEASATPVASRDAVKWEFSLGAGFEEGELITSLKEVAEDGGAYTVYYRVSAPNHVTVAGPDRFITFKIDKATLTLTPNGTSAIYGTEIGDIEWDADNDKLNDFTYSGLWGDDKLADVLAGVTFGYEAVGYEAGSESGNVGKYDVKMTVNTGAATGLRNYVLASQTGKGVFEVTPRPITVDIDYKSATYGITADEMNEQLASKVRTGEGYNDLYTGDDPAKIWSLAIYAEDGSEGSAITGSAAPKAGTYYIYGIHLNGDSDLGRNYDVTFWGQEASGGGYNAPNRAWFVVSPMSVTISLTMKEGQTNFYDGTGKEYVASLQTATGVQLKFEIKYWREEDGEGFATTALPVNVGKYRVKATIVDREGTDDSNNYSIGSGAETGFEIYSVDYDWADAVIRAGFGDQTVFTYNGAVHEPVLAKDELIKAGADGVEVTVSYDVTGGDYDELRNAGTYEYTATFKVDSTNYNQIEPVVGTITINPYTLKADDVTWITNGELGYSFVYAGKPQNDSVYATYNPFVNGSMTGEAVRLEVSVVYGDADFRDVGTYTFAVNAFTGGNYTVLNNSITQQYEITRQEVWIEASDHADIYYGDPLTGFDWNYMAGKGDGKFYDSDGIVVHVNGYDGEIQLMQGYNQGTYVTRISGIDGDLSNYTINGYDGEDWRSWWRDTAYEGALKIVPRPVSLQEGDVTLPKGQDGQNVKYTGGAYSALVNALTDVYGDDLGSLAFVYTYSGTTLAGDEYTATKIPPTEAGAYTVVITLDASSSTNKNANYVLDVNSFNFTIDPADFTNVTAVGSEGIVYNSFQYYFLEEHKAEDYANAANGSFLLASHTATAVNNQEISWTFSLTGGDFADAIRYLTEVNDTDSNIATADAYTVYYKVSAPNHKDYTGSFTVTIGREVNEWTTNYAHDGWAYKGIDGDPVNPAFTGLTPNTAPEVRFGDVGDIIYKYYETRTGEEGSYIYDDEIPEPTVFFNNETPAGTYYVVASIDGTENYTALTFDGTIVVKQHTLSLAWQYGRLTADDQAEITQNVIEGYDTSIMEYVTSVGLTNVQREEGRITADVVYVVGSYSVTVRLTDDNYCWSDDIVDAGSEGRKNAIIRFTVSELENEVVIEITADWTYGDSVTVDIVEGGTPAEGFTIAVAASSILDGDEGANVTFSYAVHREGVTEGDDSSLVYSTEMPVNAGTYWLRVIVTGEDSYGTGSGYKQFEIKKRTLAEPGAHEGGFTYRGSVQRYEPEFGEGFEVSGNNVLYTLPNGTQETIAVLSGNAYINAGSYEATVSLTDAAKNNYAWETNGTKNLTFAWSISKQVLDAPVFAEKGEQGGGASLRTTYDPATTSWLLSGFDADIMGILSNTDAYYTLVDGNPAMAASDAGTHSFVFNIKASGGVYNYYWRGQEPSADGGTVSVTWTIDPFEYTVTSLQENYGVSFGDASKEYNGQEQSIAIAGSLPEGVGVEYSGSALNVTGAEGVAVTATFYNTSDNYTVKAGEDTLTATLVITPKVLTEEDLVWSGASASYTYAYMASSMLSRVTVSFTGVSGRSLPVPVKIAGYTTATGGEGELTDFENAGTYTFVLDYEAFEYGNYQLPEGVEQDYVITRRSITVYIGDQFATYNGDRSRLRRIRAITS